MGDNNPSFCYASAGGIVQRLRLERDEIVTLETLTNRGLPNTEVAAL
jgi:hypothetical protein